MTWYCPLCKHINKDDNPTCPQCGMDRKYTTLHNRKKNNYNHKIDNYENRRGVTL